MEIQMKEKKFQDEPISLEDALEVIGVGWFNYKLAIIGGIAILSSYLALGIVAFTIPAAECDLQLNSVEKGRLASAFFLGLIISCHLWGFLSDTLGRRYILIRCLFCDAILYIITMLIHNKNIMTLLRVCNGFASCGGVVSIYAYIGEFQSNKFRPRAIMIASLVASMAYPLLPGAAWLIIPAKWKFEIYTGLIFKSWRLYYMLSSIPGFLASILLMCMPESPKFLLAKGETEKVMQILERMHRENNNKNEFKITKVKIDESERVGRLSSNKNKMAAFFNLVWDQTVPLLKKPHRKNFILISLSLLSVFFSNNGIYIWLPEALNKMELYRKETGIQGGTFCQALQFRPHLNINNTESQILDAESITNGDVFITSEKVACIEDIDTNVYQSFTILGTCQFISWIVIVLVIKYCHKKCLLVSLIICTLVAISSLKIPNSFSLMAVKTSFIIVCTGVIFPILNSITVELFPTNLRAMAGCLTLMASRLGTVSVNIISGILIDNQCELLLWCLITPIIVLLITVFFLPMKPKSNKITKKNSRRNLKYLYTDKGISLKINYF